MRMKNIFIAATAIACLLSSCKKFLATKPDDFISGEHYYSTEAELEAALTGVYSALAQDGTFSRNLVMELAHGTDEGFYKRDDVNIIGYVYNYDASYAIVDAAWRQIYDGINRANLVLLNIDKPAMDEQRRKVIKGEALFLRAFMYYHLVDKWGDVPLLLKPIETSEQIDNPRTSAKTIFEQITKDMQEADTLVRRISEIGFGGRVSKTAIEGILARVYLKWAGYPLNEVAKFADAKLWAEKVVASGEHSLAADYKQIFINHSQDKYDPKESIWEIEFLGNNSGANKTGSRFGNHLTIRNTNDSLGYGYATVGVTGILYKKYTDPNDVRRDWTISPYSFQGNNTSIKVNKAATDIYTRDIGKWRREYETLRPLGKDWGQTNFPVLRYADVLLMLAEAENELNGPTPLAHQYLNMVRARANTSQYAGATLITDQSVFRQTIMDERARELAFEGLRKSDLIRWNNFIQVMKETGNDISVNAPASVKYGVKGYNNISHRHLLLPVPIREISLNKEMTQNPGW
jgi:hypothetical protein